MLVEKLKTAMDSCWAKHKAFRIAFVAAFLFSIMAISIYAFSVFRPFFGWLVLVFLAVYYAKKHRAELPVGFRRRYWWLPLVLSVISMASSSYHNYTLNQIDFFVFSAVLCLVSVGFLVYYSMRRAVSDR